MRLHHIIILAFIIVPNASCLQFTELLPNPEGSDNFKEYVKLSGTEDLAGCNIKDAKSADKLKLIQKGDQTIYIIEDNSTLLPLLGSTVYSAGSAIGNGLDNTQETLSILCKNESLAQTAYNISQIAGYKEGMTIIFDGSWTVKKEKNESVRLHNDEPTKPVLKIPSVDFCNSTLLVTVSNTTIIAGEQLTFTVLTDTVALVDVKAGNLTIYAGDTKEFTEFAIDVPDVPTLRISASADSCQRTQRATRIVTVLSRKAVIAPVENIITAPENIVEPTTVKQNVTSQLMAVPEREPVQAAVETQTPQVTREVIVDSNRDAIPWIAGFGMVTLIVSAVVFFKVER